MARKKKSVQPDEAASSATNGSLSAMPPAASKAGTASTKKPANEPSTSALIICRNK